MSYDAWKWGNLAVFGPGNTLVGYMEIFVSREDANIAIGRPPDYDDSHTVSWGRVTIEEATHLVSLEPDPECHAEELKRVHELFIAVDAPIGTLYYVDTHRGQ
jgi:hypothetical protein